MSIEKDCIEERIKLLDSCIRLLKIYSEKTKDVLELIILQKHALKRKEWNNKTEFLDLTKKCDAYLTEIRNLDKLNENNKNRLICPITKTFINDEYKSPCGHFMERSAAKELSNKYNGRATCPYVGCNGIIKYNDK